MNLSAIAGAATAQVHPKVPLILRLSAGSTTSASGKRTPSYGAAIPIMGSVQPMQYKDLMQTDGLNLQGTRRKIYLDAMDANGRPVKGIERISQLGGDLITDANESTVWLTALVLEQWPQWTAVAATLQNERNYW